MSTLAAPARAPRSFRSRAILALAGVAALVASVASVSASVGCGSSSNGSLASDTSVIDNLCAQLSTITTSCGTTTACDTDIASDCTNVLTKSAYNDTYLNAVAGCGVVCGDAGLTTVENDCAAKAAQDLPATTAFTALANAFCASCASTGCLASFTGANTSTNGDSSGNAYRVYTEDFLTTIKTTCLPVVDAGQFGCEDTFFACAEKLENARNYVPSSCASDAGK